jgi:hypothetical protein
VGPEPVWTQRLEEKSFASTGDQTPVVRHYSDGATPAPGQDVDCGPPVDRQSFKQEENIYCLEKFQMNKFNVYLQFKLNYDVCYIYIRIMFVYLPYY